MKIVFLADFENDWKETKYMDQKAGSIAVARWTSMRLSLQEFSKFFFKWIIMEVVEIERDLLEQANNVATLGECFATMQRVHRRARRTQSCQASSAVNWK